MKRKKNIYWFLQIDKTENIRFCQKYKCSESISLKKNKTIIDKLVDYDIERLCWIGNEVLDYPDFIEILKYAKKKKFTCELLFNDKIDCETKNFDDIVKYIDNVTISIDDYNKDVNTILRKNNNYFEDIMELLLYFITKHKEPNILTMASSVNINDCKYLKDIIAKFQIGTWKLMQFMPIFLDKDTDTKELALSRINFKHYLNSSELFDTRIKCYCEITQYDISRYYNIILPNGDIAATNGEESILIGNMLYDDIKTIQNKFKYRKKYIIPKKEDEKVRVFIAHNNKKIVKNIISSIKELKYVEIIGTADNGEETIEKILITKPEFVFINYDFEDIDGFTIMQEISKKLNIESPVYNFFAKNISDDELMRLLKKCKLNLWVNEDYTCEQYKELLKEYKQFRDGR